MHQYKHQTIKKLLIQNWNLIRWVYDLIGKFFRHAAKLLIFIGTVSQDVLPPVFFINHLPTGLLIIPLSPFLKKIKIWPPVSTTETASWPPSESNLSWNYIGTDYGDNSDKLPLVSMTPEINLPLVSRHQWCTVSCEYLRTFLTKLKMVLTG